MSSNNSKPGSTPSRTIFKKRNGADVVAGDEDRVTRVDPLHIVKANSLNNFVAEPDRAREVLKAAITDIATITRMAAITDATATADVAPITEVAAITDVIGDAHDLPGLRNDIANYDWSMKRILEAALER